MKLSKLPTIALALAMTTAPATTLAEEDELELSEALLFFELNDTDGDLGIHGKADGDEWRRMKIEGPNDRILLDIRVRSKLRRQGLTELFFESAEPTFDELDPEVFFARFPEGVYDWEGRTTDGEEIEGEVFLSHRIPAAPVVESIGEDIAPADDECWDPGDVDDVTINWSPVTHTHASLGAETGTPLGDNSVLYYEFVVEIDGSEFKSTALLPPETTSWTVPEAFIELAESLTVEDEDTGMQVPVEEIKFEIIVRVETGEGVDDEGEAVESQAGNQSALEGCFDI